MAYLNNHNGAEYPKLGGFVTSNKDFVGSIKSRKENPCGLFSEQIFGPKLSFKCECGELNGIIHENEICPKCGVMCGDPNIRATQFGQIRTEFPFIKPTKQKHIVKYLGKLVNNIINTTRIDVNIDSAKYLAVKNDNTILKIVNSLNSIDNFTIIPFRIIGIYSLYISLKFAADYLNNDRAKLFFDEGYITDIIKVLPPNLRMFSIDQNKDSIITPPINKAYTSLLNCKNMNAPMIHYIKNEELEWLEQIKISLDDNIIDQEIFPVQLTEYDMITAKYQTFVNKVYEHVYESLSGKTGLIRNSILGKTIEFSGRTVITGDPSIPPYQIKVSKKMLKKLWMPYFLHYLIEVRNMEPTKCFEVYMLNELDNSKDVSDRFDEFLEWFYDDK